MALSVVVLTVSCEKNEFDSHRVENTFVKLISNGEIYTLPLNYFTVFNEDCVLNDTIFMNHEVKTQNTGFTAIECVGIISSQSYGNYTVRRCLYKTSFEIFVSSWGYSSWCSYLPFTFEAEEIWLNEKRVYEQPWVFEKVNTILTELPVNEEEKSEIFGKYLLDFQIVAHNRYYEFQTEPFSGKYHVTRLKKDETYISGSDVTVTVTYNWHPD